MHYALAGKTVCDGLNFRRKEIRVDDRSEKPWEMLPRSGKTNDMGILIFTL